MQQFVIFQLVHYKLEVFETIFLLPLHPKNAFLYAPRIIYLPRITNLQKCLI